MTQPTRSRAARTKPKPSRNARALPTLIACVCLAAAALGIALPRGAHSQDRNFAGSMQTNYMYVPTDANANRQAFDGFTNELSLKVAVDFSDNISANVKLCYGCHGVEVDMAFADLRVIDELNVRVGRFNPSFGDFPLRHDPANHRTSDKPLPYDMGRMLRMREYNLGVLPAPYVDNGVEVNGTHWFGHAVQLDYAAYVVGGLRAGQDDLDINFAQSHSVYYVDNNSEPAVGGRVAMTFNLSDDVAFTAGASGMAGHMDPARKESYVIGGIDLYSRLGPLDMHAEYLLRRQQFGVGDNPDARFRYGPDANGKYADYFIKDGFYVEANLPVSTRFELVGRFDGLRRIGNAPITSTLHEKSGILRYTLGFNIVFDASLRLKLSGEYYDFSDFKDEVAINAGLVAAF